MILLGQERFGQGVDERFSHRQFLVGDLDVGQTVEFGELVSLRQLVGVHHHRHHQRTVERAEDRNVLLGPHHEPRDAHPVGLLHRPYQQRVRLGRVDRGNEVGAVEVDRVDLVEIDEALQIEPVGGLGSERCEFLVGDGDVVALGDLVALDDVAELDLLAGDLVDALLPDARAVASVELVEPDRSLTRRRVQLHRHVHETEADRTRPHWSSHRCTLLPHPDGTPIAVCCHDTRSSPLLLGSIPTASRYPDEQCSSRS